MKYLIPLNILLCAAFLFLGYTQYGIESRISQLKEDSRVNRYLWEDLRVNHNTAESLNGFFNAHFDRLKKIENDLEILKEKNRL